MYYKLLLATIFHGLFGTAAYLNQTVLSPIEYLVRQFCNQTLVRYGYDQPSTAAVSFLWSFLNACYPIGYLLSTFVITFCSERIGRKGTTMVINNIMLILSSLLMWTGKEVNLFELMVVGRTISGICLQICVFGFVYLAECSDVTNIGLVSIIFRGGCVIWYIIGATFGLPSIMGKPNTWEHTFLLPILPAIVHLLGAIWMPESPKHLYITKDNKSKSAQVITFYQGPETNVEEVTNEYEAEIAAASGRNRQLKLGELLKIKHLRWPFLICLVADFSCRTGGFDIENFYSTGIIHELGVSLKTSVTLNVFLLRFPCIILVLITLALIKKVKARPYLLATLVGGLASITLLFLAQVYDHFKPDSKLGGILGVTSLFVGLSSWHLGSGYIPKLLPGKICLQISRSRTAAYQATVRGVTAIIFTVVYPPLTVVFGAPLVLFPIMISGYLSFIWLWKYLPETKDKSVDDVVRQWMDDPDSETQSLLSQPAVLHRRLQSKSDLEELEEIF